MRCASLDPAEEKGLWCWRFLLQVLPLGSLQYFEPSYSLISRLWLPSLVVCREASGACEDINTFSLSSND